MTTLIHTSFIEGKLTETENLISKGGVISNNEGYFCESGCMSGWGA